MSLDVSVLIPTYNKKPYLELTLVSLCNQTYPSDKYEIVIIDDGSTDGTDEAVSLISFPCPVKYIKQENSGRSAARNKGIEASEGAVIVFHDDDVIAHPTFIEEHMKLRTHSNALVVAGYRKQFFSFFPITAKSNKHKATTKIGDVPVRQLVQPDDIINNFSKIEELANQTVSSVSIVRRINERYGPVLKEFCLDWLLFITSNLSVPKKCLLESGLFDESFQGWGLEDWELGYRLYRNQVEFKINMNALNYHQAHPRNQRTAFVEQAKNYLRFCNKHPYIEIYLLGRFILSQIDIVRYNDLVKQFYNLNTVNARELQYDYFMLIRGKYGSISWHTTGN